MTFSYLQYVPCLRWKLGEYQAIWRLPSKTKRLCAPLIEVPAMGYDFEDRERARAIDEHIAPFAKRVHEKWGRQPCFVDLNLLKPSERMASGTHPICFVFDGLRRRMCSVVPVTGIDRDDAYQEGIRSIVTRDRLGVCLRTRIEHAAKKSFADSLNSLLSRLKVKPSGCDLIIDLGSPNFVPIEGFSKVIQTIVSSLPYLNDWRTFTILGTSFPKTMAGIRKRGEIISRHEWVLYKILITAFRKVKLRLPAFGDYAINSPEIPELDWRVVKPAATIRYTTDDGWYIVKGENTRDEKYGRFKQYRKLSRIVVESRHYCGSAFSWGDEYIARCADGSGPTGHLPMWRQVGTNHHIMKVTQDIASFYASSTVP